MPIKSINYLLPSFGLKTLLIASICISCDLSQVKHTFVSSQLENPGLTISSDQDIPQGWVLEKSNNFTFSKLNLKSFDKLFLSSELPGDILFHQTLTLDSGDYFLMAKYSVDVDGGAFFIRTNTGAGIEVKSNEYICLRTIFAIQNKSKNNIKVEFGFSDGSIGNALIDTILVYKNTYVFRDIKELRELQESINKFLNIDTRQLSKTDVLVDKLAGSINTVLLKNSNPLKKSLGEFYTSSNFQSSLTSYLSKFIEEDDLSIENSYCQKSSLSLEELLRLYQIPTRQLHWQKNCSGFHQFLEYYNAYDKKWEIIDLYYGIRYVDKNGNYLNFEEIESLVRDNKFTKKNIKKIDIGHLYYNENEILEGWLHSGLAVYVLNK